jgi:hypothetical protein
MQTPFPGEAMNMTMKMLAFAAFLLAVLAPCESSIATPPDTRPSAADKVRWQQDIQNEKFDFPENQANLLASVESFRSDCQIQVTWQTWPRFPVELTVSFVRNGKVLVTLPGTTKTVFTGDKNILYFAEFEPADNGSRILAFDLTTGVKVWETELQSDGAAGHFAYWNEVAFRPLIYNDSKDDEGQIVVYERENFGNHMDILDRKTGVILAHKMFSRSGQPPPADYR